MKMRMMLVSGLLFVVGATDSALAFTETFLYSVAKDDGRLRTVDPSDGSTTSFIEIRLDGDEISGATGLAMQPGTGDLFALLKVGSRRRLATIDPITGVAELIGTTSDKFAGISFDSDGVLYGVTGDGASTSESLFTLSLDDASSTFVLELGDGDDGEAIGFNPDDGLMYHASGRDENAFFQTIDLDDLSITDIALSGDSYDEAFALAYAGGGTFYLSDLDDTLFTIDVDGDATFIAALDHESKGLVYVPEPGSLALLSIGALGLLRRRSAR